MGRALYGRRSRARQVVAFRGKGSEVNVPIAILIWPMIIPIMMKAAFSSILSLHKRRPGLLVTLFVNWLVKPFSMALIGWIFFRHVLSA